MQLVRSSLGLSGLLTGVKAERRGSRIDLNPVAYTTAGAMLSPLGEEKAITVSTSAAFAVATLMIAEQAWAKRQVIPMNGFKTWLNGDFTFST